MWLGIFLLVLACLCGPARGQETLSVTFTPTEWTQVTQQAPAGEEARAYVTRRLGEWKARFLAELMTRSLDDVADLYRRNPDARAQLLALARGMAPPPSPPEPARGESGNVVQSAAPVGVLALLGWGVSWGSDALSLLALWGLGYLCWEWRPLRRLLFGVARRLYRRSWED